ncbi:MAG: beta-N-acetylhexosaminidase [Deltaproteobacteria bacterium]|nr:beta-N-acetylhexosaminidase [Deltaproteobacteria bacterium]
MKLDQIRRRVGQMFMVGFEGTTVSSELKHIIENYFIGGVVLFSRNIESLEQVATLTNDIQALSKTPLFICVDQELGKVRRFKEPFTDFGNPSDFVKTPSPKLSFDIGFAVAQELRAIGVNFNFAPVVDINTNPQNPIIGDRAFSSDPNEVSKIASGFFRGLQRGGVVACAKHFPGHGDTQTDSHLELPTVETSIEQLKTREWIPFERVIRSGIETVMTAHIFNKNLDPTYPATLSKKTLRYLREDLRFQKGIITDDLEMKAILDHYSIEEATQLSIQADVDFLLICKKHENQIKAIETVLRGVLDLKIPVTRIEESSERITKIRNRYILPFAPVSIDDIQKIVGCETHQELAKQLRTPSGTPE